MNTDPTPPSDLDQALTAIIATIDDEALPTALELILKRTADQALLEGNWPLLYGAGHCLAVLHGVPESGPFAKPGYLEPAFSNPDTPDLPVAGRRPPNVPRFERPAGIDLPVHGDDPRVRPAITPLFRCGGCGESFGSQLDLNAHQLAENGTCLGNDYAEGGPAPGGPVYRCFEGECGGQQFMADAYDKHMRGDHGIDPHDDDDPRGWQG